MLVLAGSALAWQSRDFPPGGPPTTQPDRPPAETPPRPIAPGQPGQPGQPGEGLPSREAQFIANIERAHGAAAFKPKQAIRADLNITFGGEPIVVGTLIYEMSTGRSRIELESGETLVFDGELAWVAPADSAFDMARFHLRTWPYFLTAPFKLDDPGTRLEMVGLQTLNLKMCEAAHLSFEADVGDSPEDWYYICADPRTYQLAGLVYIVTYHKSVVDANHDPRAIVYSGYTTVDGVKLSTVWNFYRWDADRGTYGPPEGRGRINNIEFIVPEDGAFAQPPGARQDTRPAR
jgi:hypothetical protein